MPLVMAVIALALTVLGTVPVAAGILLAGWGLVGTAAPVAWWTWLSRVLPDDAEAGGGLMVAVIQLAIAFGATAGGVLYDMSGYRPTFAASAAALCASALVAGLARRAGRQTQATMSADADLCEATLTDPYSNAA
jgi:predicted MFS family arabinose efflux permease